MAATINMERPDDVASKVMKRVQVSKVRSTCLHTFIVGR